MVAEWQGLPVVVITCQVLQEILERLLPQGLAHQVTVKDYGLHRVPAKMTRSIQESIDEIETPSLVVLGYGLCGNGLNGVQANQHTLLVPRTDDCIAILLGSRRAYMREFESEPGTYWLTKGWLESGSNPLQEYRECLVKYGAEQAMWIMDQQYQHYKRLVLVTRDQADMDRYRPQAQEVATFCSRWGMRYEERLGSDDYVVRLVEATVALGNGRGMPEHLANDFVVVPPGGQLKQLMFLR
jgi:hypothetical protein